MQQVTETMAQDIVQTGRFSIAERIFNFLSFSKVVGIADLMLTFRGDYSNKSLDNNIRQLAPQFMDLTPLERWIVAMTICGYTELGIDADERAVITSMRGSGVPSGYTLIEALNKVYYATNPNSYISKSDGVGLAIYKLFTQDGPLTAAEARNMLVSKGFTHREVDSKMDAMASHNGVLKRVKSQQGTQYVIRPGRVVPRSEDSRISETALLEIALVLEHARGEVLKRAAGPFYTKEEVSPQSEKEEPVENTPTELVTTALTTDDMAVKGTDTLMVAIWKILADGSEMHNSEVQILLDDFRVSKGHVVDQLNYMKKRGIVTIAAGRARLTSEYQTKAPEVRSINARTLDQFVATHDQAVEQANAFRFQDLGPTKSDFTLQQAPVSKVAEVESMIRLNIGGVEITLAQAREIVANAPALLQTIASLDEVEKASNGLVKPVVRLRVSNDSMGAATYSKFVDQIASALDQLKKSLGS